MHIKAVVRGNPAKMPGVSLSVQWTIFGVQYFKLCSLTMLIRLKQAPKRSFTEWVTIAKGRKKSSFNKTSNSEPILINLVAVCSESKPQPCACRAVPPGRLCPHAAATAPADFWSSTRRRRLFVGMPLIDVYGQFLSIHFVQCILWNVLFFKKSQNCQLWRKSIGTSHYKLSVSSVAKQV